MKKLMIAAAAAAMIGGAEAQLAQVYDFTATLKTTQCKEAKVSKALENYFNGNFEKGEKIGLRKQTSRKILGLIWGCNCPTIENPAWRIYGTKKGRHTIGGYAFWDQKMVDGGDYYRLTKTAFKWDVINRIDAMNKCEGAFVLANRASGQAMYLFGAGFGTVKEEACEAYVPSISGNLAGFRQPNDGDFSNCVFCQDGNGCIVDPLCDICGPDANYNPNMTVAYGTWKIKFNSKVAKKLASNGRISNVYSFKKAGNLANVLETLETKVAALDDFDADQDSIDAYLENPNKDLSKFYNDDEELTVVDDGVRFNITSIAAVKDAKGNALFPEEAEVIDIADDEDAAFDEGVLEQLDAVIGELEDADVDLS